MSFIEKIPDLSGKVYLITGGTAGLGLSSAKVLAAKNATVFITGRSEKRGQTAVEAIRSQSSNAKAGFLEGDFADLASVKAMSDRFKAQSDRLDVLMCNAGSIDTSPAVTKDGYETSFQTNHLGHALLIKELVPTLQHTAEQGGNADVRIVNLTSAAYQVAPFKGIEFDTLKTSQSNLLAAFGSSWGRYGQAKLANMLYANQLAKQYPQITSVAVHPGYVEGTDFFKGMGFLTALPVRAISIGQWVKVDEGCNNQVWAATCPTKELHNGGCYFPVAKEKFAVNAKNESLATRLWEWTEKELKSKGY